MDWTDLPCNELLRRIFSVPPRIGEIDIFDIVAKTEGPTVIVSFDLVGVVPDNVPAKWGKDFNRCRLGIYCVGISSLCITGLATHMMAKIRFEISDEFIRVFISGNNFDMSMTCTSVSVTGPSLYNSV